MAVTVRSSIRCDNDFALKQCALASGKPVRVLQNYYGPDLTLDAAYETRRQLLPKVRALLDFLTERFGRQSPS